MEMVQIVLLLLAFPLVIVAQQQCNVEGECLGSVMNVNTLNSYDDCLKACKSNENCHFFTFFGQLARCNLYLDCPMIDSACVDCYSGEKLCPLLQECNEQGQCIGNFVGLQITESAPECLSACKDNPQCQYCTFFDDGTGDCLMMSNCDIYDDTCSTCISYNRNCTIQSKFTLIMAVGGEPFTTNSKVEVLDISGQGRTCQSIADSPTYHSAVGTFINDQAVICGGKYPSNLRSQCYIYDVKNATWVNFGSMTDDRYGAAGINLDSTRWWVTGGCYDNSGTRDTTELLDVKQKTFSEYADLVENSCRHNLVWISDTQIMLLGESYDPTNVRVFDIDTNYWNSRSDTIVSRVAAQAGLVTFPNGTQAVVLAGGDNRKTSEMYSLVDFRWRYGPDLPVEYELCYGSSLQTDNTFIIGGGYDSRQNPKYLNTLIKFDPELEDWVVLPEKFQFERDRSAMFFVPEEFVTCH